MNLTQRCQQIWTGQTWVPMKSPTRPRHPRHLPVQAEPAR